MGAEAIANHDDVATWDGAASLVNSALDAFGDLHVLVNNAGILRDRVSSICPKTIGSVIHVHLKGHFAPTRHAATYWREQAKQGKTVRASVINTPPPRVSSATSANSNYGAAKVASLLHRHHRRRARRSYDVE